MKLLTAALVLIGLALITGITATLAEAVAIMKGIKKR